MREHSRSPSPWPQRRKGMDSPTCLLQRKRREATTGQSLSAWLCHLVSHSAGCSWCPAAAPKRDRTLCSQRCAHAGKALYLDWREDFKGQEGRTEREQLDKGQPRTVTLQKKHKRPCYSQKTKKEGKKKRKIQKYTHSYNRNIWFVTWGNRILNSASREDRLSAWKVRLPTWPGTRHTLWAGFLLAGYLDATAVLPPICFWLNV